MLGDNTPEKTPGNGNLKPPWQPGQSGNPKGRPKGARSKLSQRFFEELLKSFEKDGTRAIQAVASESPKDYVRALVTLFSRDLGLDDESAAIFIARLTNASITDN